jgi:hypothetical protein
VRLCYIDESGTPQIPGNTSHYVLAGLAIPINKWKSYDAQIEKLKQLYGLDGAEIHTAWLLRSYIEQSKITDFSSLDYKARRFEVIKARTIEIQRLTKAKSKLLSQVKKNYAKTTSYIHLTSEERKSFVSDVAHALSGWNDVRLFAECINKLNFDPTIARLSVDEQAFEQVVTRFEKYLQLYSSNPKCNSRHFGLLIHDNNETEARKLTDLMKKFHTNGTFWVKLKNIIETPLFVNSELTSMVQLADLCAYAIRRYLENQEDELFNVIYLRGDRDRSKRCVGIRHYNGKDSCKCIICTNHKD